MMIPMEIQMPRMPNYLRVVGQEDTAIKVEDLTLEQAQEFAKVMHDGFLVHWETKKNEPDD